MVNRPLAWCSGATMGLLVGLMVRRELDDELWLYRYMKARQ